VLDYARASVHVKTDPVLPEVDEHQSDMRIFRNVTHARHHAIATELRVRDGPFIEYFDKVGVPGPERGVGVAVSIRSSHEHHFSSGYELLHRRVKVVEHTMLIERERLKALTVLAL